MCLAVPAKVVTMHENTMAEVDIHGVSRVVSLSLVPEAEVGSWVLIHAGFAIQVVDEEFAAESWDLIRQIEWGDDRPEGIPAELLAEPAEASA
ncbi:MAG: HypC/HybG/HupF family hydrogenase formation chaperone [Coriobacteriia bacterium]|nr:HypC/HybG/HupF family hydrogenase formation chaperone [Coriobacteriia bacterium]